MNEAATETLDRWAQPSPVTDVDIAFPARGVELTPPPADVPDRFPDRLLWQGLILDMFMGAEDLALYPAEGVDAQQAYRHLQVVLGCYGTKHEHKIDGAAWLASRWFRGASWKAARGDREQRSVGATA